MNKRYYSYNRIHPLAHQYSFGDALKQQWQAPNWNNVNLGGLASGAVGLIGTAINPKGNTSKVGNFISGAGDVVSMINPLWGAAVKGVGMLTNAAFGSNVNTEAVNGLSSDLFSAKDSIGNSLTWDTLADNIQDLGGIDVENADLGSQGWFSHAVDNERDTLRNYKKNALGALAYATDNINTLQNRQAMGTLLANGGGIHIKPSKKGTFTAQATKMGMGVQEAASHILANKENYSPAMVKKANFAKNASKWHADGGPIFKTDYDMGLTFVNAGGTHEQNPYGGVFMGMAPDGQPNQVEEGEVIFNDYVYSNRLKVPKAVRNKYKLRENKEISFADAIEEYIRKNGIEERNNDPIANRGLEAFASELAMEQEMVKAKKEMRNSRQAANGGHLFPNGGGKYILYDKSYNDFNKLYAEDSPYMRALNWLNTAGNESQRDALIADINAGKYNEGPKNMNGRTIDATNWYGLATDYKYGPVHNAIIDFANQQHEAATASREALLPAISDSNPIKSGAVFSRIGTENGPLPDTSATWNMASGKGGLTYEPGMELAKRKTGTSVSNTVEGEKEEYDPTYWWRMAGLGANAAGLMYNIFDPYHPQVVNEARYSTMSPKYIGDYMEYRPYDINYATSQQDANSAATRNALMQSTAPIRNASLLANDFNNNATRGATRRQALEYNDALRKAVAEFNRGTNQFNTQMYMDAASKNQAAKQAYFQDRLRQAQFNSQLDFQHKAMRDQAIGQGLTAIGDYLNDMAREGIQGEWARGVIDSGATGVLNDPMKRAYTYLPGSSKQKTKNKNNKGGR